MAIFTMSSANFLLLIMLLWVSAFHALSQNKSNEVYLISGVVTQTSSFCGGMPPRKEVLQELRSSKPFSGKKLFVKKGKINSLNKSVIKELTTDSSGNFSLSLPAGIYCIVEEYKTKKSDKSAKSLKKRKCMEKQWSCCDYTFRLPDDKNKTIKINYHHYCEGKTPCDAENTTNVPGE